MGSFEAPDDVRSRVESLLHAESIGIAELDGGMIGTVYRIGFADRSPVVAKVGNTPLSVEAFMLEYLRDRSDLPVPDVYHASDDLLVIEYVPGDSTFSPAVERDAADRLAALHEVSADAYGFERDTLTGPVRQPNPWTDSWIDFYRDERVLHAADLARDDGPLSGSLYERIADLAGCFEDLLEEPDSPALIHGDAWRTNVLAEDGRVTAFLDPAIYYADPEVELAYVLWTETFGRSFFERYAERRGIDEAFFEYRATAYTLYPLLVHVNLFGDEYLIPLENAVEKLEKS